jgi:putative ABC transport system permease protein
VNNGLLGEVLRMALETLRGNKLRSGLTVLGVVIGITAIVGMTSLIRGFDQSLRDSIRELGPNTIFLQKMGVVSFSAGAEFSELLRRPNLTVDDAKAIEKLAPSVEVVDIWVGEGVQPTMERVFYRGERSKQLTILGATEEFAEVNFVKVEIGRFFGETEVRHRRRVVVLGDTAYQALFAKSGLDPVGKKVRIGAVEYTVVGVLAKRPSPGGFEGADDFVVIPQTSTRSSSTPS